MKSLAKSLIARLDNKRIVIASAARFARSARCGYLYARFACRGESRQVLDARKWQCAARRTQHAMHNSIIATHNTQRAPTLQACEREKGKRAGWRMRSSAHEEKRNRNYTTESISCASQLRSRIVRAASKVFFHAWPLPGTFSLQVFRGTVTHQSEHVRTSSSHVSRKMKNRPSVAFFGSLTAVFDQNNW